MWELHPYQWTDTELAEANDASAALGAKSLLWEMPAYEFNALVCEVQAWRRECPDKVFVSGPNRIGWKAIESET